MRGEGFLDVLKSAGKFLVKTLGPIAKEVGPTVLKELVVPMLKKKAGLGLNPAGAGFAMPSSGLKLAGQGLKLAGQGAVGRGKAATTNPQRSGGPAGAEKSNPWMTHVKKVKAENPKLKFSEVLKLAAKSYKK